MSRLVYRLLILAVIVVFVLLKIPHLNLAYYWDELSPYARGILHLYDNGLSMMPDAMPPERSRGHPLLFYNLYALVFKIFGPSVFVGHSFSLGISALTLASLGFTARRLYGNLAAVLAVMLLALQPLFFAQSTFVLPEVILSLFAIWYVYFIFKHQWFLASVVGILGILTKESAIVFVAFGGLYAMFHGRENFGQFVKHALILSLPLVAWGIFLIIQKQQMGWYLFPYHTDLVTFDGKLMHKQFKGFKTFLFHHQGRHIIKAFLILGAVIYGFRSFLKWRIDLSRTTIWLMVYMVLVFCLLVPNPHVLRYILIGFPAFFLLIGVLLSNIPVPKKYRFVAGMLAILLVLNSLWPYYYRDRFDFDEDMSYLRYLSSTKEAVDFINIPANEGKNLAADFLIIEGYKDFRMGMVSEQYLNPIALVHGTPDFVITANEGAQIKVADIENYEELYCIQRGFSIVKIFERIH